MIRPTIGRITSPYGFRYHPKTGSAKFHSGMDFGHIKLDDDVLAITDGVVKRVGNDTAGYGRYVVIEHDGYTTLSAHLRSVNVKAGQSVLEGEKVGSKGTTGSSTGVHLHFEVRECTYDKFWERYSNREWKHTVDPEKIFYKYIKSEEDIDKNQEDIKNVPENKASDWAKDEWELSFILGILDGSRPKDNITREEMSVIIKRLLPQAVISTLTQEV